MKENSDQWLCVDDLFDASHPQQVFSGARSQSASMSTGDSVIDVPLASVAELAHRWRELVSVAHCDLERCAALLGEHWPTEAPANPQVIARQLARGCDRLALQDSLDGAAVLLPRVCVLSGLLGRLIRDTYDYVNHRVVMGHALINYQLVHAKLADMVIADEIVAQRLSIAFGAPQRTREEAGWRGVPSVDASATVAEVARCAAEVIHLYVEIFAGHAFVQRAEEPPVLGVLQSLLDDMLSSFSRRT